MLGPRSVCCVSALATAAATAVADDVSDPPPPSKLDPGLSADPSSIREIEGIWVATRGTMRDVLLGTYTRLKVDWLAPNPDLPKKFFTQRQLEQGNLRLPRTVSRSTVELQ